MGIHLSIIVSVVLLQASLTWAQSTATLFPYAAFSVSSTAKPGQMPEVQPLDFQADFQEKWLQILTPATQSERYQVMANMCKTMSPDQAVAFAGYLGGQNGAIYDYRRADGYPEYDPKFGNETISMADYYEAHRNLNGLGDPNGRTVMGICVDSALMVADFLSRCGFSCDDVEIVSYRTQKSGHQVVTARGPNGEFYSANWSEALKTKLTNSYERPFPRTNIDNFGMSYSTYDCHGNSKGVAFTPMGSLLMKAHGEERSLNQTGDYNEVTTQLTSLGADEVVVKLFEGESITGLEKVQGVGLQANHEFFKNNERWTLRLGGSLIFADAKTKIPAYGNGTIDTDIHQQVLSPFVRLQMEYWPILQEKLKLGVYGHFNYAFFAWKGEIVGSTNKPEINYNSENAYLEGGIKAVNKVGPVIINSNLGVSGDGLRSVSQDGGVVSESGHVTPQHDFYMKFNHVYASTELIWQRPGLQPYVGARYDNLAGLDRSQFQFSGGVQNPKTKAEVFYTNLSDSYFRDQSSVGIGYTQTWNKNLQTKVSYQRLISTNAANIDRNRVEFRVSLTPFNRPKK